MDEVASKIKYLQGLAEGLELSSKSPEGKIIMGILEALEEVHKKIDEIETRQKEFSEFMDLFVEAGEEMDNFMSFLEANMDGIPLDFTMVDDDLDEEDEDIINIECTDCGRKFFVNVEDIVEGTARCPSCGKNFSFADLSNYFYLGDGYDE